MKPLEPRKQGPSYTVIAGGTAFALALARQLPPTGGHRLAGDVTDPRALKEARMEKADLVVAATEDDNVNLLVAQLAREMFGVRRVIALLNDPGREDVYRELGVEAFSPAAASARELVKALGEREKGEGL
jgi:trk system potassium uptake protein TrkA